MDRRGARGRGRAGVRSPAVATGPAFTPTSLSSLRLMLEPSSIVEGGGAGTGVTQWTDLSGQDNHYTEASIKPSVSAGATPNGKQAVLFGDVGMAHTTAQRLTGPSFSALADGAEIFIVAKKLVNPGTANEGYGGLFRMHDAAVDTNHIPFTDGTHYLTFCSTVRKNAIASPGASDSWFLLNLISVSGEFTARWNRSQYFTTATNTVGWSAVDSTLGIGLSTFNAWFEGYMAGVWMFANKLAAGERASMESYISTLVGV